MRKKLLVIGCGYLGYHIANYSYNNKLDITVIGRTSDYVMRLNKNVRFIEAEISEATTLLSQELDSNTIVVYAVGSINATNSFDDLAEDLMDTYLPFVKLLNICAENNVKKFVFLSSAGTVYGDSHENLSETHCLQPINIYGLQKVYFENLLKIKNIESNLPYLVLRISNPYGGYQSPRKKQGIIPILFQKAAKGEILNLWTDINTTRDYIYIDDFMEIFARLVTYNENDVINIGSGMGTSLAEVIGIIENVTGKKIEIQFNTKLNMLNIKSNVLNISKMTRVTHFESITPIDKGIFKTYQEYYEKEWV